MQDASEVLMKLRPIVFHYREDAVGAEETKALLLNEAQVQHRATVDQQQENSRQQRMLDAQARLISEQRAAIAALTARVDELEAR